ncbi:MULTISPECIES: NAD(P)/FAD-dependent oxidoreductase [Psychrilyobacter]|uniref:FAD/NAD(P)-binding domain-containing protein n=1 Tax=Psychrilyobacter piezotolerans TaxID=2293438 RepID=A0ABX9KEN2_9FUSO|nr:MULTISPECIES: FAD-dependent oxidoreductase [Psychrilyobacter]MCS5422566.1 FAD-dependent oxidoreductase [Psychrilyobacter sp. S5]NDI78686.1 FAD-dependent oxidoreductase [Psychrilyobacter piezotolerans]RDE59863.1 hypothetical protein DV867_11895 [Psychrilyobacter sp. S5]REI40144.1 hypothetical protein DYH56_11895 [Psychrilyobacter piezotolerans]
MKKIVVFGGGIGGISVLKKLEKYKGDKLDITLVEPKDYVEVPYGMLRAIVDPLDYGKKVRRRISEIVKVRHIQAKLVKLHKNKAILDNDQTITFDYCIIATGSTSRGFEDLKINYKQSFNERKKQWEAYAEQLKSKEKIAIIGGGTVGVELAGEIAEAYPNKKVLLFHNSDRILSPLSKGASKKAHRVLSELGVQIILNTRATIEENNNSKVVIDNSGKRHEVDIIYKSFGNVINTDFLKNNFSNKIDNKNQIKVNSYLQIEGVENIWAIGDINNVPEIKLGTLAIRQADRTASNILKTLNGKKTKPYKPIKGSISFITLGRKNGIAQLPFIRLDFLASYKQKKDLFVTDILYKS